MTIAEVREICKTWIDRVPRDVLIVGVLILSASASFGLGYLAGRDGVGKDAVTIEVTGPAPEASATTTVQGSYVASKNGSKYYLSTCAGAARISEANKVWFASAAAATAAGYTPVANCKGL